MNVLYADGHTGNLTWANRKAANGSLVIAKPDWDGTVVVAP